MLIFDDIKQADFAPKAIKNICAKFDRLIIIEKQIVNELHYSFLTTPIKRQKGHSTTIVEQQSNRKTDAVNGPT